MPIRLPAQPFEQLDGLRARPAAHAQPRRPARHQLAALSCAPLVELAPQHHHMLAVARSAHAPLVPPGAL
eukprot:7057697-Prymnesium_polylepis.1